MATNSPAAKPKKVFRISRFAIGVNVLLQIADDCLHPGHRSIISRSTITGGWDFSRNQKYVLREQTRSTPGKPGQAAEDICLPFPDPSVPGANVFPDVNELLKEYQYAAHGKLEVETIDVSTRT